MEGFQRLDPIESDLHFAEWDESKHPRDGGKFAKAPGKSGESSEGGGEEQSDQTPEALASAWAHALYAPGVADALGDEITGMIEDHLDEIGSPNADPQGFLDTIYDEAADRGADEKQLKTLAQVIDRVESKSAPNPAKRFPWSSKVQRIVNRMLPSVRNPMNKALDDLADNGDTGPIKEFLRDAIAKGVLPEQQAMAIWDEAQEF